MSFLLLLGAGLLGARLANRLRIPQVIGELCAGIALGPTLLGYSQLPPSWLLRGLLLLYLFTAGLESHGRGILSRWRAVLLVSAGGIVLPFAAGWAMGGLFMATAMSITALPVLMRILSELRLTRTEIGSVAIGAAAVDDFVGWSLFSFLHPASGTGLLAAFTAGSALGSRLPVRLSQALCMAALVLAPAYFASVGLRADFLSDLDAGLTLTILVVACLTKLFGAYAGAALAGLDRRTSIAVAFGMNARGAMEMVLATTALEAGLIGRPLFVALVVMALITSVMAGPGLRAFAGAGDCAPR